MRKIWPSPMGWPICLMPRKYVIWPVAKFSFCNRPGFLGQCESNGMWVLYPELSIQANASRESILIFLLFFLKIPIPITLSSLFPLYYHAKNACQVIQNNYLTLQILWDMLKSEPKETRRKSNDIVFYSYRKQPLCRQETG